MNRYLLFFTTIMCMWTAWACTEQQNNPQSSPDTAQSIVDSCISVHGGDNYLQARISFDFRGRSYTSIRRGGQYQYERSFVNPRDSLEYIHDVLSNEGFYREINGERQIIADSFVNKYSNALNSVIYFACLPYGLNDGAVYKKYIGEVSIKDEPYHKVQISFDEEGGGEDFDDVFIYWIHTKTYQMDYLAYRYHVNGGGVRFREAYHQREVGGIRFADYVNYKMDKTLDLSEIDKYFEAGVLSKLSLIELENLTVEKTSPEVISK